MKKFLYHIIIVTALLTGTLQSVYAVRAYPYPIQVKQPDGSVLTIQKHGDEFLNWTTSGGRLVKQGADGFYYLASFTPQGTIEATAMRVSERSMPMGTRSVTPPAVAVERARQLRAKFLRNTVRTKASSSISMGSKRFLVLLVQFNDLYFSVSNSNLAFTRMLNQEGYSENGGTGSVRDYYYENSSGAFAPEFDVIGPITLSKSVRYYGANKEDGGEMYERSQEMVIEAAQLARQQYGVNFSQYDNDGDGIVDNVFVFFAGHNEAEGGPDYTIWPHAWNVYYENVVYDGVRLSSYACASELRGHQGTTMAGIGTYCHEFGHVLGMPDFYDTDGEENGWARGLASFSLMSGGNYNNYGRTPPYLNIEERNLLGWYNKYPMQFTESKEYFLSPVTDNACYIHHTSNNNEYFLFEYREKKGWDYHLPGTGLLIYHVDKSNNKIGGITANDRWASWDGINAYANHQCFDLIEAVYPESAIQHEQQVPFPGSTNNTSFTPNTLPAFVDHAGYETGIGLTDIKNLGNKAAFTVIVQEATNLEFVGRVTNVSEQPIQGASVAVFYDSESVRDLHSAGAVEGRPVLQKVSSVPLQSQLLETTTDAQGNYTLDCDFEEGKYIIQVTAEGYVSASEEVFVIAPGLIRKDFSLYQSLDYEEGVLKKHSEWDGYWRVGFKDPQYPVYGAVGFSAEELEPYVGDTLQTIQFIMYGSTASEVGVFVLFDKEVIFERELSEYVFNAPVTVDISDAEITIPEGKLVRIGYYVVGIDDKWPLAADEGPMVYLGGYAAQSMHYLIEGEPWPEDFNNIIISATVKQAEEAEEQPEDDALFALGYYLMPIDTGRFQAGDQLLLKLNDVPFVTHVERPLAVQWFVNEIPYETGDTISLEAGSYIIKSVLSFEDYTQTIVREIFVE